MPGWKDACQNPVWTDLSHLSISIPTGGTGTVEDCTRLQLPLNLLIRHGQVCRRLQSLGIHEVLTAPQSPWQNAYAERLIGSIRRECLNHFIILNTRHLKRTLAAYFCYYHRSRPHLTLGKQCPIDREVMKEGSTVAVPEVGGLHHRYERVAA
jgi:hypothetical protein